MRGRTAPRSRKPSSNVISPIESWKNTADMPTVAMARAISVAICMPRLSAPPALAPQRVDADRSATMITLEVVGCSNSRTISGLKLVSDDCGQSMCLEAIAGLPVAQADEVEARAVKHAGVLADRELAHPLEDEQLDLGDLREVDERLDFLFASPQRAFSRGRANNPERVCDRRQPDAYESKGDHHGIGVFSMMSLITASVVRPWLAACGPSQRRWPST